MHSSFAVFNTDGVNRLRMLLPLSALAESLESHVERCVETGLPIGIPFNVSHDLCRPLGWASGTTLHLAKDLGRQLGVVYMPETADEGRNIERLLEDFWEQHHYDGAAPFAQELLDRLPDDEREGIGYLVVGAAAMGKDGLAARLYPEFFSPLFGNVDKDGLVDYDTLLSNTEFVAPGVFRDPKRDLLLFAHRYFRRSLSHRNNLNEYALRTFHKIATASQKVTGRLRLDPDLLGHFGSFRSAIELEYWRGPQFSDDILKIPTGVAEHKSDRNDRHYSGVDKTQVWWKDVENRPEGQRRHRVRTLEVEELVDLPTPGLGGHFGCRYAHAEYDADQHLISHFDGAIRAYSDDAYLLRIDQSIDRAGKRSQYTKVFRLDGAIAVADWKRLLADYYRGNELIPEYFGEIADVGAPPRPGEDNDSTPCAQIPGLSAAVSFAISTSNARYERPQAKLPEVQRIGDAEVTSVEVGRGALEALLRKQIDTTRVVTCGFDDGVVNLPTLALGGGVNIEALWSNAVADLIAAIETDIADGLLTRLSLAISWSPDELETTLSIAGEAERVQSLLLATQSLVKPTQRCSSWIEAFRDQLVANAPDILAPVEWPESAVTLGRLTIYRPEEVVGHSKIPVPVVRALRAAGVEMPSFDLPKLTVHAEAEPPPGGAAVSVGGAEASV
jgi:hypothetical protein